MKVSVEFQEPDRKKKIKRTIAREGLILLGFVALFVFWCNFPNIIPAVIGIFGYSLYWLIRFIIWVVRTLKERQ